MDQPVYFISNYGLRAQEALRRRIEAGIIPASTTLRGHLINDFDKLRTLRKVRVIITDPYDPVLVQEALDTRQHRHFTIDFCVNSDLEFSSEVDRPVTVLVVGGSKTIFPESMRGLSLKDVIGPAVQQAELELEQRLNKQYN